MSGRSNRDAAGMRDKLKLIYANDGVSLIPVAGDPSVAKVVNPHTFVSTTAAIQQIYTDREGAWARSTPRTPSTIATTGGATRSRSAR